MLSRAFLPRAAADNVGDALYELELATYAARMSTVGALTTYAGLAAKLAHLQYGLDVAKRATKPPTAPKRIAVHPRRARANPLTHTARQSRRDAWDNRGYRRQVYLSARRNRLAVFCY